MSRISEYLSDFVYPQINAAESGWLDSFNAKPQTSGAYSLDCPTCNAKNRGFYYPGRSHLNCNRKQSCVGKKLSLWDVLLRNGVSNSEVLKILCDTAGVPLPDSNQTDKINMQPSKVMEKVTKEFANKYKSEMNKISANRNLSADDLNKIDLGYYPSSKELLSALEANGLKEQAAIDLGYLPKDYSSYNMMENRAIFFWRQPGLKLSFCGYHIDHSPTSKGNVKKYRKYYFSPGLKKTIPYLFDNYSEGPCVAVEGVFDAWALRLCGDYRSMSIGGSELLLDQAAHIESKGVRELIHLVDADQAGYRGALKSIEAGSPFGIKVRVSVLSNFMGDADNLRQIGRTDLIVKAINKSLSAGEFAARILMLASKDDEYSLVTLVHRVYQVLPAEDKITFNRFCTEAGIEFNKEAEAVRYFSALLSSGLNKTQAHNKTLSKFDLSVTVTERDEINDSLLSEVN